MQAISPPRPTFRPEEVAHVQLWTDLERIADTERRKERERPLYGVQRGSGSQLCYACSNGLTSEDNRFCDFE